MQKAAFQTGNILYVNLHECNVYKIDVPHRVCLLPTDTSTINTVTACWTNLHHGCIVLCGNWSCKSRAVCLSPEKSRSPYFSVRHYELHLSYFEYVSRYSEMISYSTKRKVRYSIFCKAWPKRNQVQCKNTHMQLLYNYLTILYPRGS